MTSHTVLNGVDAYREELIASGLLIPTGVPGVYGRSGLFEGVIEHFEALVTRAGRAEHPERVCFPPIIPRRDFETSEYLKSFPQLAGSVHSFNGTERDHIRLLNQLEKGEDWTRGLPSTEVTLTPAACYPIYPQLRGTLPPDGKLIDMQSYVFRHEPSPDPCRMQMFRQREYVRIGTPDAVRRHRDLWLERGLDILKRLELPAQAVIANDPFFGRAGQMLANNQREQSLKFELVIPIGSADAPTACISCNYHQDHFGHLFGIRTVDGADAHTACIGFGLERIALALFRHHGLDPDRWSSGVRDTLDL